MTPPDPSPAAIFASISNELISAYKYDACDATDPWKKYDPAAPGQANDMSSVDVRSAVWLQTKANATLTVTGTIPTSVTVPMCQGPNLIGYPSGAPVSLPSAFVSIADNYDSVYNFDSTDLADPWKIFTPSNPSATNDLSAVGPGRGYWVDMLRAAVLQVSP